MIKWDISLPCHFNNMDETPLIGFRLSEGVSKETVRRIHRFRIGECAQFNSFSEFLDSFKK
jgi:hypothetical protein